MTTNIMGRYRTHQIQDTRPLLQGALGTAAAPIGYRARIHLAPEESIPRARERWTCYPPCTLRSMPHPAGGSAHKVVMDFVATALLGSKPASLA